MLILFSALIALPTCKREPDQLKRIEILPNSLLAANSRPTLLATNLDNPESPFLYQDNVVFSQSGKGEISMVSQKGGPIKPLITGFAFDNFNNYKISVQGIVIDPVTKQWIVCAAEDAGYLLAFTPTSFPTTVATGRKIVLEGADADNPYDVVLPGGRIIIASGGTAKAYGGPYPINESGILKPLFTVSTGITGLAIDPKSGDVFGAVFGTTKPDGSVIRFQPTLEQPSIKTVASGFTNLVDVAFTPDGQLLALEFGSFPEEGKPIQSNGTVSIVSTDGTGKVTPLVRGLANPTGLFVSDRALFITEFGASLNNQRGNLISIPLTKGSGNTGGI